VNVAGSEGADWLLGNAGNRPAPVKLKNTETLDIDAAERFLEKGAADGKRLRNGIDNGSAALKALKESGLTGEALVVLIAEKCGNYRTDGGRYQRPTSAMVQCVLEALFRLGEYVR
jgi:hypothetical protein